jgi:hypothetical protein
MELMPSASNKISMALLSIDFVFLFHDGSRPKVDEEVLCGCKVFFCCGIHATIDL